MKKIIACVIAAFSACCFIYTAGAASLGGERAFYEANAILEKLKIAPLTEWEDSRSRGATRSMFVNAVVRAVYGEVGNFSSSDKHETVENSGFSDVAANDWAAFNIRKALDSGIIKGKGDGNFCPGETVKTEEALYIAVNALGYGDKVNISGGYSAASNKEAMRLKLLKDTAASYGGELSEADAKILIYNMLLQYPMIFDGEKDGGTKYAVSQNRLIYEVFGAEAIEGVVTANEFASIMNDETAGEGAVTVQTDSGEQHNLVFEGADNEALLGRRVFAVYRVNDGGRDEGLLCAERMKEGDDILTVTADEITSFDSEKYTIRYTVTEKQDRRHTRELEKKVSFPKSADVIYNGTMPEKFSDALSLLNNTGEENLDRVVLLDYDNDGRFDVVKIYTYSTIKVSAVNADMKLIYDYDTNSSVDFDDDDIKCSIEKNGETADFGDISKNDCLSVYISKNIRGIRYAHIVAQTNQITGEITASETENGRRIFRINDKEYTVSKSCENSLGAIGTSRESTFLLNHLGVICAVITNNSDARYAIVVSGVFDTERDSVVLKLFNSAGEMRRIAISEKFRLDDVAVENTPEGLAGMIAEIKGKLVDYKCTADGELKSIKTPSHRRAADTLAYSWGQNTTNDRYQYKLRYKMMSNIFYREGTGGGMLAVNSDTRVFFLPGLDVKNADDDEYRIGTASNFKSEGEYIMEGYSVGASSYVSDIVLVYGGGAMSTLQNTPSIVTKCMRTVNEDNDVIYRIEVVCGSDSAVYETADEYIFDVDTGKAATLKRGDIIRVRVNSKGECDGIMNVRSISEKTDKYIRTGNYGDEYRYVLASVYQTDGQFCYIAPPESITAGMVMRDGVGIEMHNIAKAAIRVIDEDGNVRGGSAADIIGYCQNNSEYTRQILIYTYWGQPSCIYVYE